LSIGDYLHFKGSPILLPACVLEVAILLFRVTRLSQGACFLLSWVGSLDLIKELNFGYQAISVTSVYYSLILQ
jgi:hypothetical protein